MATHKTCFVPVAATLDGCAGVPRDGDCTDVERMASERTPRQVHWYQGGVEDAAVDHALQILLAAPLTVKAAVPIARRAGLDLCVGPRCHPQCG